MNLRLYGSFPQGLDLHVMYHGNRMDFSPDHPVEVDLEDGETVTLVQDPPLTRKWKALAALGILLTAPLQGAYMFYSDHKWNDVIPYRLRAVLHPTQDGSCNVQVNKSNRALHPPKLEVTGDGVALEASTCESAPQVLHQAFFIHMCRLFGLLLWALALFGALFYGAMTQNNTVAAAICAIVSLGLVAVCGYIAVYHHGILRRNLHDLAQIHDKDAEISPFK